MILFYLFLFTLFIMSLNCNTKNKYLIEFQNKYKYDVINNDEIKLYCSKINFTDDECYEMYDYYGGLDSIEFEVSLTGLLNKGDNILKYNQFIRKNLKDLKKSKRLKETKSELEIMYSFLMYHHILRILRLN